MMPDAQGGERWPCDERNLTTLVDETSLPLADCAMDRVLLVHELENSEAARAMLREIWRVLVPDGDGCWRWCPAAGACGRGSSALPSAMADRSPKGSSGGC